MRRVLLPLLALFLLGASCGPGRLRPVPDPAFSPDPKPVPVVVPPDPDPDPDRDPGLTLDLSLVFLDTPVSTTFLWPFATPPVSEISSSISKPSFPSERRSFVLPEEKGGYAFEFFATKGIAKNAGAHQGLKMSCAAGDYILFPAVKGMALKSVRWVTGAADSHNVSIVRQDGAAVSGGETVPTAFNAPGDVYAWYLSGTEKETAYKFRVGAAGVICIQQLILHYASKTDDDVSGQFQEVLPDEIPDFSRVGYHWGDREIPEVPVRMTLQAPSDGSDALAMIQEAVNTVETPGAILLKAGTYRLSQTLHINRSGVVLRGEGEGTVLYCTAPSQIPTLIELNGKGSLKLSESSPIIARYVPVGQRWVPVRNPEQFSVGERVWIYRPATEAWLDALHMRELTAHYSDVKDWSPESFGMRWERRIMAKEGHKIWLDNPVVMSIGGDPAYGAGSLCKGSWERISECGIESLTLDTRYDESVRNGNDYTDENHAWSGITVKNTEHSWIRNVTTRHFGYCAVDLANGAKHVTVSDCTSLSPVSQVTGSRRYAFHFSSSQLCLIRDCRCDDDRHQFVCGARVPGPNVFLRCTSTHSRSDAGPHHRWSTGTLYDNLKTDGRLNVQDRADYGTGHGWAGVNTVCYNCEASQICIQSPWVTGQNWAIGCIGKKVRSVRSYNDSLGERPDGTWISPGVHVSPESLYESQLSERHTRGEYIDP